MIQREPFLDNEFKKQIIISRLSDVNLINIYCFEDIYSGRIHFKLFFKYKDIVLGKHIDFIVRKVKKENLTFDFIEYECRRAIKAYVEYIESALFSKSFVSHPNLWNASGFLLNFIKSQNDQYNAIGLHPTYFGDFDDFTHRLIDKHIQSVGSASSIIIGILEDLNISQDKLLKKLANNPCLTYEYV